MTRYCHLMDKMRRSYFSHDVPTLLCDEMEQSLLGWLHHHQLVQAGLIFLWQVTYLVFDLHQFQVAYPQSEFLGASVFRYGLIVFFQPCVTHFAIRED